jgi:hypothetical protein
MFFEINDKEKKEQIEKGEFFLIKYGKAKMLPYIGFFKSSLYI